MVEIERVRRPFWIHQVVEYMVGIVLIAAAAQMPRPAVPALMGVIVLLNAAIAIGPAGAFRVVGHKMHRRLDLVVIALLVFAAFETWVAIDSTGRWLLAAMAFVLFFIWFHTDFEERPSRKQRTARSGPQSEEWGRQAGRAVGSSVNSLKRWKDSFDSDDD